ncbi:agl cluster protein AglQ [Natrialbaceae archaeon GCM10025810]|uniref:agl cluster protein AglQ n=1 Tax=Halovalidus salilacus TaxID=3075124 RepID=UPI00360B05FB
MSKEFGVDTRECITLTEIIVESADRARSRQQSDGSFNPGSNGPHEDEETPVRNTANWLVTFIDAYEQTGSERFLEAAENALNYLLSKNARPEGAVFHLRDAPEKDQTDGLVGQAIVLEALIEAGRSLGDSDAIAVATDIIRLHTFDSELGLWKSANLDGSPQKTVGTYNQQIHFAAVAAGVTTLEDHTEDILQQVRRFMDQMEAHAWPYSDGLLRTLVRPSATTIIKAAMQNDRHLLATTVSQALRESLHQWTPLQIDSQTVIREKAVGYQGFHLYGLALLARYQPDHKVWNSSFVDYLLAATDSGTFRSAVVENKYGFPYNPSGFEIALALEVFQNDHERARDWVELQLRCHFNWDQMSLAKGTPHPRVLAARIYEATRLSDYTLPLKEVRP